MKKQIIQNANKKKSLIENRVLQKQEAGNSQHSMSMTNSLLWLQKTAGNRAVRRLLEYRRVKGKLEISQPGIEYEREHDRVNWPIPCQLGGHQNELTILARGTVHNQKSETGMEEERCHKGSAPGGFERAISGHFSTIPYLSEMETVFNQDFSAVKAYMGRNRELTPLGARAATFGERVAFAELNPERKTVAHELAHIAQNRYQSTYEGKQCKLDVSSPLDLAEQEADAIARKAAAGMSVRVHTMPSAHIHLEPGDIHQITFGVGGYRFQELIDQWNLDYFELTIEGTMGRLISQFRDQLRMNARMPSPHSVSSDFFEQINERLQALTPPSRDVPLQLNVTVEVTEGQPGQPWQCRVTNMSHQMSVAGVVREAGRVSPYPEIVRHREAQCGALISRGSQLLRLLATGGGALVFAHAVEFGPILGSFISMGFMIYEWHRLATDYLRYADREGFWRAIAFVDENGNPIGIDPRGGIMRSAQSEGQREEARQRYSDAYDTGVDQRVSIYRRLWQELRPSLEEDIRQELDAESILRYQIIAAVLQDQYRTPDDRRILFEEFE